MAHPSEPPHLDAALRVALDALRRKADVRYAEVRFVDETQERLRVRDGRPEQVTTTTVLGGAVTVLAVVVVVSQEGRRRGAVPEAAEGAEEAYVPLERQGRSRSDST